MKKDNEFKIVCSYCNAPYTAEMEDDLCASNGCITCGTGTISGSIDIKCSNCKKVIYKKEY